MAGNVLKTPEHRFGEKLWALPNGCIVWMAHLNMKGYARFYLNGWVMQAHRWAYGEDRIPEGLTIDHLCRNRACQNAEHMEPVTNAENVARGVYPNALKTHCVNGHSLEDAIIGRSWNGKPRRQCRPCYQQIRRQNRARAKARRAGA